MKEAQLQPEKVYVIPLAGSNYVNTSISELGNHIPFLSASGKVPFTFAYWVESGVRGQELARNRIVKRFLDSDADILVMIDHDMVISSYNSLRVLETKDWDIVAPVQLMFDSGIDEATKEVKPQIRPCAFIWDEDAEGYRQIYPAHGVSEQKVDAVGGGFICIRRRVLEDPRMLLAEGWDPPAFFRTVVNPNYTRVRGNDVDFCDRARQLGYRTKINWSCPTGHLKTCDLYQLEVYAKQQFLLGYDTGGRHALSVEGGEDRKAEGAGRGPGAGPVGDEGLARLEVDREGSGGLDAREAGAR